MPPCDVAVLLRRHRKLGGLHEVDSDESRYVGDGITCSTDEWADFKLALENLEERSRPSLVGLAPSGDLGNFHLLHGRMQMTKDLGYGKEQVLFETPVPHLRHRPLEATDPKHRG